MSEPVIINITHPGQPPVDGDIVEVQDGQIHTRYRWPIRSAAATEKSPSEKRADAYKRRCDPLLEVIKAYELEVELYPEGSDEHKEAVKKLAASKAAWLAEREAIRREFA